jgi:hypothetical protein
MDNKSIYYVYQYNREDGTPYYIGKGKGNRVYSKQKNINLPTDPSRIVIIKDNLTEQESLRLETELIKKYGRKDNNTGVLRNRTDGGEGVSGHKWTKKQRKAITSKLSHPEHIYRLVDYYHSLGLPKYLIAEYLDISKQSVIRRTY